MDGVIYHGGKLLPGAAEFVEWVQNENKQYLFLTNNSSLTPYELRTRLLRMGLDIPEEHFYTSALSTARFLQSQKPGCSVYVIGGAGLIKALYDVGISMNEVNPDYVVVGETTAYSLETITKAINMVRAGARLIGANSDVCGPTEHGMVPACGSLVAPIEMATGRKAYFCGKPNALMVRTGIKMLGCRSAEAVMIGDNMDTDILAGVDSGVATALVLTGVSTMETIKEYSYRPTGIYDGIGAVVAAAKGEN